MAINKFNSKNGYSIADPPVDLIDNTGNYTTTNGIISCYNFGHYGSFSDSTTQTITTANTEQAITFNTTEYSNGVSIGSPTSKVIVSNSGIYNFQFSAQLIHTAGGLEDITIWARINGTDVPRSSTDFTLQGNNSKLVMALNFILSLNSNDYFELIMSATDNDVSLWSSGTRTSPTRPALPSIILTVTQIN